MPQMGVQPIPAILDQPLPQGTVGLILGRGSLTLQGLIVYPGLVDNQHVPRIQILCSSPGGVFSISKGDRIAQIILLPNQHDPDKTTKKEMGSTGQDSAYLVVHLQSRPKLRLQIRGKEFEGILDTGADTSIISSLWWPKSWPVTESTHSLQGLGYQSCPNISSASLQWVTSEGQKGQFTPYVLPLPVNLWGRDVLSALGLVLSNEYSPQATSIMERMGYTKGEGLGRHGQGRLHPLEPHSNKGRQGLGFS